MESMLFANKMIQFVICDSIMFLDDEIIDIKIA